MPEVAETIDPLFVDVDTDLAAIKAADWYIEHSSGGGWWFRNRKTQRRQAVPRWIEEMVFNAQQAGMSSIQYQLADLLDTESEPRYIGPCNPFFPKGGK